MSTVTYLIVGTVKWFDPKKGYGFITTDTGKEFFAFYQNIKTEGFKKLRRNQKVIFDHVWNSNQALNIHIKDES